MKKPLTPVLLAAALLAGGCAPTIGNKADVSTVTFELGKTTKDTVAGTLGLPADITRSAALRREYWAYRDQPALTGVMYAVPTGAGTVTTFQSSTGETGEYQFEDAAVVYVFDEAGVLLDVRKPEHEK